MAANRFLDNSPRRDLATPFSSGLLKHAQKEELRPIVVEAARQRLAIELEGANAVLATEAFDKLMAQVIDRTNAMIVAAGYSLERHTAGLAPDSPIRKMCEDATVQYLGDYVAGNREFLNSAHKGLTRHLERSVREAEQEPKRGLAYYAKRFWQEY